MDSDIQWYENGMKKFISNLNGDIYSENDRKSWVKCTDFYLSEIIDFFQTTPEPPLKKGGATTEMEIYLFTQNVVTGIIFRFGIIMDLIQEVNEELLSGPLDPSVSSLTKDIVIPQEEVNLSLGRKNKNLKLAGQQLFLLPQRNLQNSEIRLGRTAYQKVLKRGKRNVPEEKNIKSLGLHLLVPTISAAKTLTMDDFSEQKRLKHFQDQESFQNSLIWEISQYIIGACSALILLSYTVWLNCQIKNGQNIGNNLNSQNGVNDAMPNVNGGQIQNNANAIPIADCRQLQNNANEIEQHNVEGMPA